MSKIEDEKKKYLKNISSARNLFQIFKTQLGFADKGLNDIETEIQRCPDECWETIFKTKIEEKLKSTTNYIFTHSPQQQFFASGANANVTDLLLALRDAFREAENHG